MKTLQFPTKYKLELLKEKADNYCRPFMNKIYSFRDNLKATNGHWLICAKNVKEEEITDIISNEDLAYIRKKYAKIDMMPVETITQEEPIVPFDAVMPNLSDCQNFVISLNPEYLAKLAKVMGTESVTLYINNPLKAFYVVPNDKYGESEKEIFAMQMPCLVQKDLEETYLYQYLEANNKL